MPKKRLIIFEGIAGSGKTTLEKLLADRLTDACIIAEAETLMPLIDNKDAAIAKTHLLKLLDDLTSKQEPVLIVDRFHFTHAFRTASPFALFLSMEKLLETSFDPLLILLSFNEKLISERLQETIARRGNAWAKGKKGALEERVIYYRNQQRRLAELFKESTLPKIHIDTSDKDWERCLATIVCGLTVK